MVSGGNESVSKNVGDFLGGRSVGKESRREGVTQSMRAIPANETTTAIGPIYCRSDRPRGQWTPP